MNKTRIIPIAFMLLILAVAAHAGLAQAAENPIELKFAHWLPPVATPPRLIFTPWAEEIEKKSNGAVKITFYGAESLGKAPDHYDLCLKGTADIVWTDPNYTPGVFPYSEAIALPMEFPSSEVASAVFWQLVEKHLKNTEYKNVKVLWAHTTGLFQLFNTKRPVKSLQDLKGLKLAATSTTLVKSIKALGGVPVFMPEPDIYTSLERGMIDGRWMEWEGAWVFKTHEVTKHRAENVNLATSVCVTLMNLDAWNRLPSDIQKLFDELNGLRMSQHSGAVFDEQCKLHREKIVAYDKTAGNPEIIALDAAERQVWEQAAQKATEDWIKEKEKKGLQAKSFMEDLRSMVKKHQN